MGQWFYLDYSHGFVRRALPGELLALVSGASPRSVEVLGWAISFAAVPALVFIAWRIGALASRSEARLVATTLVLICPLGLTTILRDPGRMDYIGMVAMAAMLLVATLTRASLVVAVLVAAFGAALAVASEEFLIVFLTPVVVALLYVTVRERSPTGAHGVTSLCAMLSAVALLPAVTLAAASVVAKPSSAYLDTVDVRSNASVQIGAVFELRAGFRGNLHWVFDNRAVGAMAATTLIWLFIYALTVIALRIVLGRLGGWYWVSASYFALGALLGLVTIDYRRWWTLAFVSHLVVVGILGARERHPREETSGWSRRVGIGVVALAFLVSLYGQILPNTVRPSDDPGGAMSSFVGNEYVKLLVPFWLRGKDMP
jgi:hypothetical protein